MITTRVLVWIIAVIVSACSSLFAQTGNYKTGSLLWKISGKELAKPSYLLGTMHFKSGAFLDSIPGAGAALDNAEQVIGEIVMNDMAELIQKTQEAIMMTPDTTYQMLYTEDEYQLVNEKLTSLFGGGLDQMSMIKPAGISMFYSQMLYVKKHPNFNPLNGIDAFVQKQALEANKPVLGLETVQSQIQVLYSSSLKEQSEDLLCLMKNPEHAEKSLDELLMNYNKKDLNALYRILKDKNGPCPYSDEDSDQLNKNRNDAWMKNLPTLMKEKSSFIVVGALHLAGEEGLLNQLEKAGYVVEPVL